ncbi:MAG: caspase family protein [Hyphomicrobiaceae bacterium]|nr:caspase family protein [Hyphomicrobiaceae bacterium]
MIVRPTRFAPRRLILAPVIALGLIAAIALASGLAASRVAAQSPPAGTASDPTVDGRRKAALLIGISDYRGAGALRNPQNDVAAVARRLSAIGFAVTELRNAGKAEIEAAITAFAASADGADIALVYYSGHGVQIAGENYALPVDYDPARPPRPQLVSIGSMIQRISAGARAKIVLLDACRNNPFFDKAAVAELRPSGKGMAPIAVDLGSDADRAGNAQGIVVGYATQSNDTADDGTGALSPYAQALLAASSNADEDLNTILVRAAGMVLETTGGRQHPEHRVAMTQPLYLLARKTPLQCDVLAAERDNNISLAGVEFDAIDDGPALAACDADSRANPDNPRLLHNLGRVLDKIGRDAEAVATYERAAAMGYDWSMNNLGVMHLSGEGVPMSPVKALGYFRAAFDRGNRQARINYAGTDLGELFADAPQRTRVLQAALIADGQSLAANGRYDAATRAALDAFKSRHALTGPGATLQALDRLGIVAAVFQPESKAEAR